MGCTNSKHRDSDNQVDFFTQSFPPHPGVRPALRKPTRTRPPTPPSPSPIVRRRTASGRYIENPQRRYQRTVQMGEKLFNSGTNTPSHNTPTRKPTIPRVARTPSSISLGKNGRSPREYDDKWPTRVQGSPVQHLPGTETPPMPKFPPGTALPYSPHDHPTPPPASSCYSSPHQDPRTPPIPRSNSYRSYSGRMMYSPVRFPADSSPYGTPTIRVVQRSGLNVSEIGTHGGSYEDGRGKVGDGEKGGFRKDGHGKEMEDGDDGVVEGNDRTEGELTGATLCDKDSITRNDWVD